MKYISLLLTSFIYIISEYLFSFGNLGYNSFKRVLSYGNWFGNNIIGWQINKYVNINVEQKANLPDNIVVISNHINFIDILTLPKLLMDTFPEHKLMFITRDKYRIVPIVGNYFANNHILIKNKVEEDLELINNKLTDFKNKNKKTMILIFPEGIFMTKETIKASNNWCAKIGIKPYNRCLAPRTSGIFNILNIIKPSVIVASSIIYTDNISNNKGTEYSHLLYDYFPKFSCISMKLINTSIFNLKDRKQFDKDFYKYWRNEYDTSIFV
jgi:hypothetical protein